MRDALTLLLQSADFSVRSYPSAESFLSEVDRSQPLCLLTDVRLPDMDGIALYRHLVELGLGPATVVITAHGDIPTAVMALKEGIVDFVEKPFDPAVLLECMREAWRRTVANQERKAQVADIEARRSALTPREAEILELLVKLTLTKRSRQNSARARVQSNTTARASWRRWERARCLSSSRWCSQVASSVKIREIRAIPLPGSAQVRKLKSSVCLPGPSARSTFPGRAQHSSHNSTSTVRRQVLVSRGLSAAYHALSRSERIQQL